MWQNNLFVGILVFLLCYNQADCKTYKNNNFNSEESDDSNDTTESENERRTGIGYYEADSNEDIQVQTFDGNYNRYDARPTIRSRNNYERPAVVKPVIVSARSKDQNAKAPPVQTIRNYSKVNDDGTFTFGYEAADGSFKEETRGTDCVVRGKYGYIDPDGNKREFTYVSGNPCDPNNPDGQEIDEESESSEENSKENIPENYPRRPTKPIKLAPTTTTIRTPIENYQNNYPTQYFVTKNDDARNKPLITQQQQKRIQQNIRVQNIPENNIPSEVTIKQKPRITVTSMPFTRHQPISITPRVPIRGQSTTTIQPPATTYRPTSKVVPSSYSIENSRSVYTTPLPPQNHHQANSRIPVNFDVEFQNFQKEHNILPPKPNINMIKTSTVSTPTSNPIYESQLTFDPSSGQYDTTLYQQLPQTDGDFQLNHRIQPYVHQYNSQPTVPQLINFDNIQVNPNYRRAPVIEPQFSQQIYEKEKENLQVLNSQQLFQQQQELQQKQLHQDRIQAAQKFGSNRPQNVFSSPHRITNQNPIQANQQSPPGLYYIQPSGGQIDAFLKGLNY